MKPKKVPLRKCIGCGEMAGKRGLIRVVRSKEGEVSVDVTGKLPGRGAYLCLDKACVEKAKKSRAVERALKCPIPEEIYKEMERIAVQNE